MATCSFDWHQNLRQRVEGTQRYATPTYAIRLQTITGVDRANWAGTQADRESGTCTPDKAFVISDAPNTPVMRFVRVRLTQSLTRPHAPVRIALFVVTYRVQREPEGAWLVDAELDGGS